MPLPKSINKKRNTLPDLGEKKELPSLDDGLVESLSVEEQFEEPKEETYRSEEKKIPKKEKKIEFPNDDDPLYSHEPKKEPGIDVEKKRLIPFGGKKSDRREKIKKINARVGDFDNRKNSLVITRIIRIGVLLAFLFLFVLGIKNTFFPKQIYTPEEIDQLVRQSMGQTGFPLERGKQFAEAFINQLLITNRSDNAENARLAMFLSSEEKETSVSGINVPFMGVKNGSNQKVIIPARVFEYDTPFPNLGRYKVTAFVSDDQGEGKIQTTSGTEDVGHWISFSLNIYHDDQVDSLSVVPETVSLIPPYVIRGAEKAVPKMKELGNGSVNQEILGALRPTINGYVQAFANSSEKSHDDILQYIPPDPKTELYQGFGGKVSLVQDVESSIVKTVYDTDEEGVWKVLVKVNWLDLENEEKKISFWSNYAMTIEKQDTSQKYLVTNFVPLTYVEAPKN